MKYIPTSNILKIYNKCPPKEQFKNLFSYSIFCLQAKYAHMFRFPLTKTTEFVTKEFSMQGLPIPHPLLNSCAVKYNASSIFIIGGHNPLASKQSSKILSSTWIYEPDNDFHRRQGPPLIIGRKAHSCSVLNSNGKSVILVAGGRTGIMHWAAEAITDTVEIYDPMLNQGWKFGMNFKTTSVHFRYIPTNHLQVVPWYYHGISAAMEKKWLYFHGHG